jgi:hypothetical protein
MKTAKNIPLFDQDQRYVAAKEKLVQLQLKREELEKITSEIRNRPKFPQTIEREAQKLLRSETLEIPPPQALDDEELERTYREIQIVDRAIAVQKRNIEDLQREISGRVCQEVKPAYAEKIRAIVEAAQILAECAQQERDFREALTDQGITLTFQEMSFWKVGFSRDPYAFANIYARQAKQAGYL